MQRGEAGTDFSRLPTGDHDARETDADLRSATGASRPVLTAGERASVATRAERPARAGTAVRLSTVAALCVATAAGGYWARDLVATDAAGGAGGSVAAEASGTVADAGSASVISAAKADTLDAEPAGPARDGGTSASGGAAPIEQPQAEPASLAEIPQDRGTLVAEVQRALAAVGLEPGPVDGMMGPKTRDAIVAFQDRIGADPDGEIDPALYRELKSAEAEAEARWDADIPPAHVPEPASGAAATADARAVANRR